MRFDQWGRPIENPNLFVLGGEMAGSRGAVVPNTNYVGPGGPEEKGHQHDVTRVEQAPPRSSQPKPSVEERQWPPQSDLEQRPQVLGTSLGWGTLMQNDESHHSE